MHANLGPNFVRTVHRDYFYLRNDLQCRGIEKKPKILPRLNYKNYISLKSPWDICKASIEKENSISSVDIEILDFTTLYK